jgi:hypothetical protein
VTRQPTVVVAVTSCALLLAGCIAAPPVEPEEERFASRQLEAVGLTVDDFGTTWRVSDDAEATSGGGPTGEELEQPDPCTWSTAWLPDQSAFYTHSWRTYTTGDDATFAMDWIAAIEPDTDPRDLLAALRDTISACPTTPDPNVPPDGTLTHVPDIVEGLGDGSFSYRTEFEHPDYGVYGVGEVHTVLCGPLWVHLSYIGYEAFVERDELLATLLERVAPLGGCEP